MVTDFSARAVPRTACILCGVFSIFPAIFRTYWTSGASTTPGLYVQGLLVHGDMDDVIKLAGGRLTVQYRIDADGRVVAP